MGFVYISFVFNALQVLGSETSAKSRLLLPILQDLHHVVYMKLYTCV